MTRPPDSPPGGRPRCAESGCDTDAAFWLYDRDSDRWRPVCERHLLSVHPSIEVRVWLEAGYARPVELERPAGTPSEPSGGREAGFREAVDDAMDWSESGTRDDSE